jgi:hypothetical protein
VFYNSCIHFSMLALLTDLVLSIPDSPFSDFVRLCSSALSESLFSLVELEGAAW